MAPRAPAINYRLKSEVSIILRYWLCSTRYTAVWKSTSAIKVATMKNTDDFHYEGKPSRATAKSTLFAVSKEEWNTKEDNNKSMKNALYVLWPVCQKAPLGSKQCRTVKNQTHSLSHYQVTLV